MYTSVSGWLNLYSLQIRRASLQDSAYFSISRLTFFRLGILRPLLLESTSHTSLPNLESEDSRRAEGCRDKLLAMASLAQNPPIHSNSRVPSQPTTMRAAAQRPPSGTKVSAGPIRSARRVKKGVSTGTDVQHVIRVTVLGLAGITVDRTRCRDHGRLSNEQKETLPVPPSKMRAVVAFSRNSQIRGITSLSKPLARSPNNDIVLTASDDDTAGTGRASSNGRSSSNGRAQKKKGDTDSFASEQGRSQRHVAVWASENSPGLGSPVVFEAHLHRKDRVGGRSSPVSSAFAPKSFELTIALTENGKRGNRVAMPLGITSLAVAGDECEDGKAVILDLPVLSLQQARPLASNKNGFNGYPMISISEKTRATEPVEEDDPLKRRRGGLKRFFSRKNDLDNVRATKFPSVAERNAFSAAYSTDGSGDAILRVSLEVFEKGSDLARQFEPTCDESLASATLWVVEQPPKLKRPGNPGQRQSDPAVTPVPQEVTMTVPTKEQSAEIRKSTLLGKGARSSFQPIEVTPRLIMREADEMPQKTTNHPKPIGLAQKGFNPIRPSDSATTATSSGTSGSSFDRSDRSSQDTSHAETTDSDESDRRFHLERAAEGAKAQQQEPMAAPNILKINSVGTSETEGSFHDDYTLSFTKKKASPIAVANNWEPPNQKIKIFGRQFDLPTCGTWNAKNEEKNVGRWVDKDDSTHVTVDFFGRDVHIPMCSVIKARDDDTLSATATTFMNGWTRSQPTGFVDKLCRNRRDDAYLCHDDDDEEEEESLSWITNMTDGTQSNKKKLSLKDYVRLSLTSNGSGGDPRSDSRTLNSLLSNEETTVGEDASYIEEVTVDEDGTVVLETREGSDERGASGVSSTKRSGGGSDRIEETSHAPALRNEGYSKRIADPLTANIVPQQVPSDLRPSMSQHFQELFTCRTSSATLEDVVQYEPFVSDVPPVILHNDDTDTCSLGDLTANTHEKNINARHVDNSIFQSNTSSRSAKKPTGSISSLSLVPVAFGGDGLCLGAAESATISSPIPFDSRECNSLLSLNPSFENYFADYDDYSILSPEAKAQALAEHTKITPLSASGSSVYKEKIVLIAPASPMSNVRYSATAANGFGLMREAGYESMELGHEVNEKD